MHVVRALVLALPIALLACSGSSSHHHEAHGAASSGGENHHPNLPSPVEAFHDVLRPLWHSDAGAERDTRTCDQAATLVTRAAAVTAAPAPEGVDAARWTPATASLASSTAALSTACSATPRGDVARGLEAVHTSFHGLVELLPGQRH